MAQAKIKATGEVIELMPGSRDGRFCMQDVRTGLFYDWHELDRVAVKIGTAPVTVSAVQINIGATVTGTITNE